MIRHSSSSVTHRHHERVLALAAVRLRGRPSAEQGKRVEVQAQPTHGLNLVRDSCG